MDTPTIMVATGWMVRMMTKITTTILSSTGYAEALDSIVSVTAPKVE